MVGRAAAVTASELRRALVTRPAAARPALELALLRVEDRDDEAAGRLVRSALRLRPHWPAALRLDVRLRARAGISDLIGDLRRLLVQVPSDSTSWTGLARLRLAGSDGAGAARALRRATGRRPIAAGRATTDDLFGLPAVRLASLSRPARCRVRGGRPDDPHDSFDIAPRLAWIGDALVMPEKWVVLVDRRHLLIDETNHNPDEIVPELTSIKAATEQRYLIDLDRPLVRIDEPVALLGGNANYFHWLVDYLPRLATLARAGVVRDVRLMVPDDLPAFARESLALLGIGPDRLVTVAPDRLYEVTRLLLPTQLARWGFVHPWAVEWLRGRFRLRTPPGPDAPRRLYLSRRDATRRRLRDEPALERALERRGFQTIAPGSLGLLQQIRLMAGAEVVVGVHGAGLANLLFAPRGATVVEITSAAYRTSYFANLAGLLDQHYRSVTATVVADPAGMPREADLALGADGIAALLDELANVAQI